MKSQLRTWVMAAEERCCVNTIESLISPADRREWLVACADTADVLPRRARARDTVPLIIGPRRPAAVS